MRLFDFGRLSAASWQWSQSKERRLLWVKSDGGDLPPLAAMAHRMRPYERPVASPKMESVRINGCRAWSTMSQAAHCLMEDHGPRSVSAPHVSSHLLRLPSRTPTTETLVCSFAERLCWKGSWNSKGHGFWQSGKCPGSDYLPQDQAVFVLLLCLPDAGFEHIIPAFRLRDLPRLGVGAGCRRCRSSLSEAALAYWRRFSTGGSPIPLFPTILAHRPRHHCSATATPPRALDLCFALHAPPCPILLSRCRDRDLVGQLSTPLSRLPSVPSPLSLPKPLASSSHLVW